MTRSRFSQTANAANKKSSSAIAIAQLVSLGLAITLLAAIFVQNLQPAVQIFFLGQKTVEIPLSVAMLVAFVGGGMLAFLINAIASWQQNLLIRRAVIASGAGKAPKEQGKAEKFPPKEEFVDDEDEEYEDDDDEEYEDDDPDTLPYGNRPNLKSKSSKGDRPPLDAKFIK